KPYRRVCCNPQKNSASLFGTLMAELTKMLFGTSWFRAEKRITEPLDGDVARQRHLERESYCVLMTSDDQLEIYIEFNNDYVGVGILDEYKREYLSYQFQDIEPNRLFLQI